MFQLDPRLAADSTELAAWPLSRVLLMNDASYPWLILVPARAGMRDLIDLAAADRAVLLDEIVRACDILRAMVKPDKLNVAALGNVVAQLHVHVIARFATDAAWPKPVWGIKPPVPYTPAALAEFQRRFAAAAR
jgi:diadenosine tetraphosphate (Ap4A) HIT family hydrolase